MSAALKIVGPDDPSPVIITGQKQATNEATRFRPGQSGNPKGRPTGSRNKLSEEFVSDLYDIWREKGRETLLHVCEKHPLEFIKIVASIVPKNAGMNPQPQNPFDGISDEDLQLCLEFLQSIIARART